MTPSEKRAVMLLRTLGLVAEDGVYLRWMEAAVRVFEQDAERRALHSLARWANKFRTPENATPCAHCGEAWDHRYNQGVNDVAAECRRRAKKGKR